MSGIDLIKRGKLAGAESGGLMYEWQEGTARLMVEQVSYAGKNGVILYYSNRPVHQMGNPALDAYLEGLEAVVENKGTLSFLILYGANDPVHAGGDLRESLTRLDATMEKKQELEGKGVSGEKIDALFGWAEERLEKGIGVHASIRRIAESMRVVAVCGGGTRFGGSAEIPLMADYLVGDSRSGMCFSEAMIGLIPGWAGIGRTIIKAGRSNAAYMAKSGREVKAKDLEAIGIYNAVVEVAFSFPKRQRSDDAEADKQAYQEALARHDEETGLLLLSKGLEVATCDEGLIRVAGEGERKSLSSPEAIAEEVGRRSDPKTYAELWGKPLKEVKEEIAGLGRPLAPQSIAVLEGLIEGTDVQGFNEHEFVKAEMEADARLYRDRRFRAGLVATLEQRVADFR